jgi:Galactose oxidase, central domain/Kelch motif
MSESRGSFTATSLVDGRVLVVGGNNISQRWLASAEIYDPVSGLWTPTEPKEPHGIGHTATLLMDGRVLVVGGCIGDGPSGWSNRAELFDPATNSWSEAYMMSNSRCNHAAALLSDGRVLVAGGEDGEGILNSTEIFDPATRLWSKTGNLITARGRAEMVRLSDGRLLVTGGLAKDINGLHALITVEIYDMKSGKWTEAASMGHARYGHTADMLPGGLVIVIGGLEKAEMNSDEFLKSVEIYDPEGNTWTEIASLTVPRAFHSTNLLPDGHILVMGGMSQVGSILVSTDILVPAPPVIYTPTTIIENTLELDTTPEVETTTTPTSTGEVIVTSTPVNP